MSLIDSQTVKKMAELARIRLTDEEVATFSHDLGEILDYVAKLPEIEDDATVEATLRLGADEVIENQDDLLKNAVAREGSAVKVPAILDKQQEA